jgi:hypothetical protein
MNNSQHIIVNNIEELLIKEYYSKYLLVSKKIIYMIRKY